MQKTTLRRPDFQARRAEVIATRPSRSSTTSVSVRCTLASSMRVSKKWLWPGGMTNRRKSSAPLNTDTDRSPDGAEIDSGVGIRLRPGTKLSAATVSTRATPAHALTVGPAIGPTNVDRLSN